MVSTAEGWQLAWASDCSSGFEIMQEAELGGVASELGPVTRMKDERMRHVSLWQEGEGPTWSARSA